MRLTEKLSKGLILPDRVTAATVNHETFFNLCRMADQLHITSPIDYLRARPAETIEVTRDNCGNVLTAKIAQSVANQHT